MSKRNMEILSDHKIKKVEEEVKSALNNDEEDVAWEKLQPLINAQKTQEAAAISLTGIVQDQYLSLERGLEVLSNIFREYESNIKLISLIGSALEGARDIDQLNLAPSDHPIFKQVIEFLTKALENGNSQDEEIILDGLSTATRMMARQYDSIAENCYRRLVEINPEYPAYHYCLGLFCKTRGLFREGMLANQKAISLVDEPVESYQWNLGICATGAGKPEIALQVWKQLGNKIELGRFNLPEGGYPDCKVRLAERPLAERDATNDDPGNEETIWIERLSPCHGIIRSVLYQDLGIDYGDVVLIDGAPITYHSYGETQIPVFPHLATLIRSNYSFFDFAATQKEKGQISEISRSLDKDAVIYVHTENFRHLCASCWRDPNMDHEVHKKEQKHVVTGRIAAPRVMSAESLLSQIDAALSEQEDCSLFSPELCLAAGLTARAEIAQQKFALLWENE